VKKINNIFKNIISPENLFASWEEFKHGKTKKEDVLEFSYNLEGNIFSLARDLANKTYRHSNYASFKINDPKPRNIHKATVCDRIVHRALFRILNPIFEPMFISDSFSCRIGKGHHRGFFRAAEYLRKASSNNTKICLALKCDIRKFFDSVDHKILKQIIRKKIIDQDVLWLIDGIIDSYFCQSKNILSESGGKDKQICGLPLGNLTSQLFANIYLTEFDQFDKHKLKIKFYARYTDDFIVVSDDQKYLSNLIQPIKYFLENNLRLELHPNKVSIRKFSQGVDFLGYVARPCHNLVRIKTKRRIFRRMQKAAKKLESGLIEEDYYKCLLKSYLGVLSHADAYGLSEKLKMGDF